MIKDPILALESHEQTATTIDPSLCPNLAGLVHYYLLAIETENKSPLTLEAYAHKLDDLVAFAQANQFPAVSSLSNNHIRLFLHSLQERRMQVATIASYYRCLHTFFCWLVNEGQLRASPMHNMKSPRLPHPIVKPFSPEDINNMLMLCGGDGVLAHRNMAIVLTFMDTGVRLSEMAGMELTDLSADYHAIRIRGKGNRERLVRIGKTTRKALIRYFMSRKTGSPRLWVSQNGKPLTREAIKTLVRRLCQRAEVTDARRGAHTFRHYSAISFLRNGGGEFSLQQMLGHSTLTMTKQYVSTLSTADMFRAHEKASPVDNLKL